MLTRKELGLTLYDALPPGAFVLRRPRTQVPEPGPDKDERGQYGDDVRSSSPSHQPTLAVPRHRWGHSAQKEAGNVFCNQIERWKNCPVINRSPIATNKAPLTRLIVLT